MRLANGLDIQPLLIAEVVIHRGDVGPGPLADIADRRAVETAFGKDLAGGRRDSLASCI